MNHTDENTPTNKLAMSSYDNLYDGVTLPAKAEVAAAIVAVRSRRTNVTASPLSPSPRFDAPMSARSAGPTTTLFQQSTLIIN
jgi:hypothetical protein